ncbi:MAG TPA: YajQ family cyclic di-GMP-binding protein [Candidatus Omnitrophota bacterium]|nr:YajQ family cyclic di-GMP-binding protein [Candidatus Omnitrophota bacterium]HQJ15735.1 YajQ family cyclic di-GMP-binding protein [Candidatus Omnitrophota bacterium]
MASNFSFDIVSEVDLQEVDNAVNQAKKELSQRYDFRGSKSSIDFDRHEKQITLVADDDFKLRALQDILTTKLAKRGVSLKAVTFREPQKAFEGTLRQLVLLTTGIDKEKAKDLVRIIKDLGLKVQTQIEGEKIRVSGAKKDDLQAVIAHVRSLDFPIALNFTNYR